MYLQLTDDDTMKIDLTRDNWSINSWFNYPYNQIPKYNDPKELKRVTSHLRTLPYLVIPFEVNQLKKKLAEAQKGKAFVLQGGDCAETFTGCNPSKIFNTYQLISQMSGILAYKHSIPIIRIGRIAGQYMKPRSKLHEQINNQIIPVYRGDLINRIQPTLEARQADPKRLFLGYCYSVATLNFLRSIEQNQHFYSTSFLQKINAVRDTFSDEKKDKDLFKEIQKIMKHISSFPPSRYKNFFGGRLYLSHEAIHLPYESSFTYYKDDYQAYYNLSAHTVWLGYRTGSLNGAHVEFLRGINNPIGIKVGPYTNLEELVQIIRLLNEDNQEGKIMLITRFGCHKVVKYLPILIEKIQQSALKVLWICDPMHGNTVRNSSGRKSRSIDMIEKEIKQTFRIHKKLETYLGGIHLEMTGEYVTECIQDIQQTNFNHFTVNYQTCCDPRINYCQALGIAMLISKEQQKSYIY